MHAHASDSMYTANILYIKLYNNTCTSIHAAAPPKGLCMLVASSVSARVTFIGKQKDIRSINKHVSLVSPRRVSRGCSEVGY